GYQEIFARFDKIPNMVLRGEADAGLLIHEAQLTYREMGLVKVIDLWEWWSNTAKGLPMPLGVDIVSKRLGLETAQALRKALQESIRYAWNRHTEALEYASKFARSGTREQLDRFVRMYVNRRTLDMGPEGRRAHILLYQMAWDEKLIPEPVEPEFV
ncbi:MAG TPA: hypothetical protein EYP33_05675, partial [Pyrodictium sp.]|nr:hypothetical protein [Pyrodictium sp.]